MVYQPFIVSYSPEINITKNNTRRGSLNDGILIIGKQVVCGKITSPYAYVDKQSHTIVTAHTGIYTPCIDGSYDHDTMIPVCVVFYDDCTYFIHKNYANYKEYKYYYSSHTDLYYRSYSTPNGVTTLWADDGTRYCTATPNDMVTEVLEELGAFGISCEDTVGIEW